MRFYVTDGQERSEIVVDIRVAERNQPPQVVVPASRTAQEGDVIQFRIQASADSDRELTFSSDGLPFGAILNPFSGQFEWEPGYTQAGTYVVPFTVSDGETEVRFETTITVLPNNAPARFYPLDGWQVVEGQALEFSAFAYDPDNPDYAPPLRTTAGTVETISNLPATVRVEVVGDLPAGASFDPVTMQFRWVPANGQSGSYDFCSAPPISATRTTC